MKKQINIFIVSPSDVSEERIIAQKVCYELDKAIDIEINPVLWEYHPMSYHKNAQANIDDVLDKCDIFVVILWHRLGSVIEGYEGAITKSKNVTGTQYEIEKILATQKESVFFYFKTKEKHFSSRELDEVSRQRKLLDTFLQDIHLTKGSTKHGYQEFEESEEFEKKLQNHLKIDIERRINKKIVYVNNKKTVNSWTWYFLSIGLFIFIVYINLIDSSKKDLDSIYLNSTVIIDEYKTEPVKVESVDLSNVNEVLSSQVSTPKIINSKSVDKLEHECKDGNAKSCYGLGELYHAGGQGLNQNKRKAKKFYLKAEQYYTKACDKGRARQCNDLGVMYSEGYKLGAPPNINKAKELFKKSCDGDFEQGCKNFIVLDNDAPPSFNNVPKKAKQLKYKILGTKSMKVLPGMHFVKVKIGNKRKEFNLYCPANSIDDITNKHRKRSRDIDFEKKLPFEDSQMVVDLFKKFCKKKVKVKTLSELLAG